MKLADLKRIYLPNLTKQQKDEVKGLRESGLDEGEAILTVAMQETFKKLAAGGK